MKKLNLIFVVIITLLFSFKSNAQNNTETTLLQKSKSQETVSAEKINWLTFEEAVKRNLKNPKKIFIDVYTDWCGWCKKMDQTTFLDKDVIAYMNENFYAVKFDAEQTESIEFMGHTFINPNPMGTQKGTHQLAAALLQGKMSYPSYVFMNEENIGITVLPGYANAQQLLNALKYIATNAYLDTRWDDFLKQNNN
jgi:thioredoxin-related protein